MQDNSRVLQADHIDNSINNTFNFYDCNIGLQGDLNHLAQLLSETGKKEEAKALENTANALEQLEKCKSKDAGSRYFCESLFWASQPKQAAKT